MTTKVFDIDGTERSLQWLASAYDGAGMLPARVTPETSEAWRLIAIYCTTGPAVAKGETRRGGMQASDQPVAFTWPALAQPDGDLPPIGGVNAWAARGIMQRTDGGGVTGFGLGSTYGPFYHMWVASSAPSDCLTKIGMKGGTNHDGPLYGVWELQAVEPVHTTLGEALLWRGQQEQVIEFNPTAALQLRIFAAGMVPNSPEFTQDFGGVSYVGQRAEHLSTGEVRVYYCRQGDWGNVAYVTR